MSNYTPEDFAAYNLELRTVKSRIIFEFSDSNKVTFDSDDMIVSWDIQTALTDTINTPFDCCCADACSVTVYNRYTGPYKGSNVVDFKIFDPLKNLSLALNMRFKVQVSALHKNGVTWTPYKTVGIFYTTGVRIDDDRQTATIEGNDILSLIFNKSLPLMPIFKSVTFRKYITTFCAAYNLKVDWVGTDTDMLKYAYCQSTTKSTIQALVSSAAAVAYISIDDNDIERLNVIAFSTFIGQEPRLVTDMSVDGVEETTMQLISLSYNKDLQSYRDNTRIIWTLPSITNASMIYSYSADNLEDFTYNPKDKQYTLALSRAGLSNAPLLSVDYTSVCSQYEETEANFGAGFTTIKATQYTMTGTLKNRTASIPDEYEYTAEAYGQCINEKTQQLPEDAVEEEAADLIDYLEVTLPYVQTRAMAKSRRKILSAWANSNLQTVEATLRYNPYVPLGSTLFLDTHIYDLGTFTGVLWNQSITYNSGGLQSTATVVNNEAFVPDIDMYDVAGYQSSTDNEMSRIYVIGTLASRVYGVWYTDPYSQDDTQHYKLVGKLKHKFVDAAITFDGVWQLTENNIYSLITEDTPWIFTTYGGTLYAQYGTRGKRKELATGGILYCAAERGYYPRDYAGIDSDQGVIVVYATVDKVYYRTYAATGNTKAWLDAEEVPVTGISGITGVQVHRLNDYRIGIVVSSTSGNKWIITDRTYAQIAYRPERFISTGPSAAPAVYMSVRFDGVSATPQPTLTWSINEENTVVTVESDSQFIFYDNIDLIKAFTGTATMPAIASIDASGYKLIITFVKAATATFTISAATDIRIAARVPSSIPGGGITTLTSLSHTFEIVTRQEASESFIATGPAVSAATVNMYVVETNTTDAAGEYFISTGPSPNSVAINVIDGRKSITVEAGAESFISTGPYAHDMSITLTNSSIVPV